jgi:2-(1,2-epoxy-1,2-dihydrophenyl)acetyl-CoA isomerase
MTSYQTVETRQEGRVRIIAFNRPDKLNALSPTLMREYYEALMEANADDSVGAIVTTGNGRAYCAGADINRFAANAGLGEVAEEQGPPRNVWAPDFLAIECKPMIAAVNGIALGAGFTSILWYDAVIASTTARFSMRFAAIALTPEVSACFTLPRVIGLQRAKEVLLTARIYNAQEALELGIVHRIVEPEELLPSAIALGQEIAQNPSPTLHAIKQQVFESMFGQSITEVRGRSDAYFARATASPERYEAMLAQREKREPRFHDSAYLQTLADQMASRS